MPDPSPGGPHRLGARVGGSPSQRRSAGSSLRRERRPGQQVLPAGSARRCEADRSLRRRRRARPAVPVAASPPPSQDWQHGGLVTARRAEPLAGVQRPAPPGGDSPPWPVCRPPKPSAAENPAAGMASRRGKAAREADHPITCVASGGALPDQVVGILPGGSN
uniref:Uncharacterized protein n=1 Tax=Sphaerodactylus townsendi TaxID=933632 RepID=A0ACB8FPX3_9SAUR